MLLKVDNFSLLHSDILHLNKEQIDWLCNRIRDVIIKIEKDDFWNSTILLLQFFHNLGYVVDPECYGNFKPLIHKSTDRFQKLTSELYYNYYTFLWFPKNGPSSEEYGGFLEGKGYVLWRGIYQMSEKEMGDGGYILNPETGYYMNPKDEVKRKELDILGYIFSKQEGKFVKEYDEEKYSVMTTSLGKELVKKELTREKSKMPEFVPHWKEIETLMDEKKSPDIDQFRKEIMCTEKVDGYDDYMTVEELEEKLKIATNREKIQQSLYQIMSWKLQKYCEKFDLLKREKLHIEGIIKRGSLSTEEIKETFPMYSIMKVNMITLETLQDLIREKMTQIESEGFLDVIYKDYMDAIYDSKYGLKSLSGTSRVHIRNLLATQIGTLMRGPQGFINSFLNILLTGNAGIGKTFMAYVISYIYTKIHVLATNNVFILSEQDFVASYVGQTGPKTVRKLFNGLEGVIFIDEAYLLAMGNSREKPYSGEAMTEMINFIDKYIGLGVIIPAGYYEEMMEKFLKYNKGLPRRFPNRIHLKDFNSYDLYGIFWKFMVEKFGSYTISPSDSLYVLYIIHYLHFHLKLLDNQAGDIQNFSSFLTRRLLSNSRDNRTIINNSFADLLLSKEIKQVELLNDLQAHYFF